MRTRFEEKDYNVPGKIVSDGSAGTQKTLSSCALGCMEALELSRPCHIPPRNNFLTLQVTH